MNEFSAFDRANYPERVACMALPAFEEEFVSVEVTDWDDNKVVVDVPSSAVTRINMPRLSENIPAEAREPFEAGIGLGFLACRVLNRNEYLVSVDIPTTTGSMTIVVPFKRLARKIRPD